tara:strand:- start:28650 stop:29087 length:438 start_codon:yes stop_codon:yes gene_type:complete
MSSTSDRKRVAATCIVFKNSILLGKRSEKWRGVPVPYGGFWSVFGGAVEEGESSFQAACREVMEETRINIHPTELSFVKVIKEDNLDFILYAYEASNLLLPTLDEEHTEYGWFKIIELDHFPEKIDPKIVEGIKFYTKRREGKCI